MKRWLARFGLLLAVSGACLATAEEYARLRWPLDEPLEPGTLDSQTESCARRHPTRGWAIQGRCGRDQRGVFEQKAPPAAGAWRLLLVGDSVAEGQWSGVLARQLEAYVGRPVALLNGATSGYNTCQEAVALSELLATEHPDAVLLQTCANDSLGSSVVIREGDWSIVAWNGRWQRIPSALLRSRLVQLALVSRSRPSTKGRLGSQVRRCAEDAVSAARAAGVPMVVLHFPVLVDDGEDDERLQGLRAEESSLRADWKGVDVPQVEGRVALGALGSLAAIATTDEDRIHPKRAEAERVGAALAAPIAAGFELRSSPSERGR